MSDKKYIIREFIEETGQLIVEVPGYPWPLSLDLPLDENNNLPTDQDLHLYINGMIPHSYLDRKEKLKNPIPNVDKIKALIEPWPVISKPEEPKPKVVHTIQSLSDEFAEFQQLLDELKNNKL
jgi:hypothetical protein